jgi:hypothetical protein
LEIEWDEGGLPVAGVQLGEDLLVQLCQLAFERVRYSSELMVYPLVWPR